MSASLQGAGQGAGREVRVSTLLLGEGQCRKEPFSRSTEASSPHSCSRATWTYILNIYFDRLFRCLEFDDKYVDKRGECECFVMNNVNYEYFIEHYSQFEFSCSETALVAEGGAGRCVLAQG